MCYKCVNKQSSLKSVFGFSRSKNPTTNPIRSVRIHPTDKIRLNSGLCTEIRIPSVGIRWDPSVGIRQNLSVGFGRPPLLINSFNKLLTGANFRGRSQPRIGSVDFRHQDYIRFQHQGSECRSTTRIPTGSLLSFVRFRSDQIVGLNLLGQF